MITILLEQLALGARQPRPRSACTEPKPWADEGSPAPGDLYCSPLCAQREQDVPTGACLLVDCPCGHDACRPKNVDPNQPPPESQP